MDPKSKWNRKYANRLMSLEQIEPNQRLVALKQYLSGKNALDMACGLGANSLFLATIGYEVKALDISDVAIEYVKKEAANEQLNIEPIVCDLTTLKDVETNLYDLVVMTYYLDRSIFPFLQTIVRDGGFLFIETFLLQENTNTHVSDEYKLRQNELLKVFGDWHVLFYEENEKEGRQSIFVRAQK